MHEQIKCLATANVRKDSEISRLKAQINKDSANSSQPASTNSFKKTPNSRDKSSRQAGGQKGRKGTTMSDDKTLKKL